MISSGAPYMGPREIRYLFVDGASLFGYLRNISRKYFSGKAHDINFSSLVSGYTKVFYYDAIPVREPNETEDEYEARIAPIRAIFEAASSVDGIHVYEGDARRRARRGLEQKKVDVMLTVDMLTHAFQRNMHQATLLTGDGDFQPLLEALVQFGMFVTLWYPPGETSRELLRAADARRALSLRNLADLLTPQSRFDFMLPVQEGLHQLGIAGELLMDLEDIHGRSAHLYRLSDSFLVTVEQNANYHNSFRHHNYDLLRQFCRETCDVALPEEPPSS